jgi:hypothetical protein
MSTIYVAYEGRKKAVKILTPNTLIQTVITEAAQHFNVDQNLCSLFHKKSEIDKSQSFRFSNLSNNVELQLIVSSKSQIQVASKVGIALSVEGQQGTLAGSFPASSTLKEIIVHFVHEKKLVENALELSTELIYLRTSFFGEALTTVTLQSLGLNGFFFYVL